MVQKKPTLVGKFSVKVLIMSLKKCRILTFPSKTDSRGTLAFAEIKKQIPFEIKRIFYIYNVPKNKRRGGHAHKKSEQIFVALNGSFDIILDDSKKKKIYRLQKPNTALYVPPKIWVEMTKFSSKTVVLVLASSFYNDNDYIRNYNEFKKPS